jgi:hypothetical protein
MRGVNELRVEQRECEGWNVHEADEGDVLQQDGQGSGDEALSDLDLEDAIGRRSRG